MIGSIDRVFAFLVACLPLAGIVGCGDKGNDNVKDDEVIYSVSPESNVIEFESGAQNRQFVITSNCSWVATVSSDWFSMTPSYAQTEDGKERSVTVTVTAEANTGAYRETEVVIVPSKGTETRIRVSQASGQPTGHEYTSLATVRSWWNGTDDFVIGDGVWIKASVVSNFRSVANGGVANYITNKAIVLSDGNSGIELLCEAENSRFAIGNEVEVNLSGLTLTDYHSAVTVKDVPLQNITVLSGRTLAAVPITVKQFLSGDYESMYVAVEEMQVQSVDLDKTYVYNSDHTSIRLESRSKDKFYLLSGLNSTFGGERVPRNSGTIKGIASRYDENFILILTSLTDTLSMTDSRFEGSSIDDIIIVPL